MAVRFVDTARTAVTVMRLLETAEMSRVEQVLADCAKEANSKVNDEDEVLKGQSPTAEQCREVVRQEKGKDVTRVLPAYRELARVLEPWLYEERFDWGGFSREDMRRWKRRFLD